MITALGQILAMLMGVALIWGGTTIKSTLADKDAPANTSDAIAVGLMKIFLYILGGMVIVISAWGLVAL